MNEAGIIEAYNLMINGTSSFSQYGQSGSPTDINNAVTISPTEEDKALSITGVCTPYKIGTYVNDIGNVFPSDLNWRNFYQIDSSRPKVQIGDYFKKDKKLYSSWGVQISPIHYGPPLHE